jgi:hypothetical protein
MHQVGALPQDQGPFCGDSLIVLESGFLENRASSKMSD